MSEDRIRLGIIGAGNNTRQMHIPKFREIEEVEILGVVNRSQASSQAVADEFGIPRIYPHWRAAIEDPETDAILIGTWPYLHAPATLAALEAGKHVLCEARMALDAAEARTMLEAARARPDLVAQLVPAPFTLAVDEAIRARIAEGWLGPLLAVEMRLTGISDFIDREAPFNWREDFEFSGFNTMTLGIWYESLMRWVGHARRVQALTRSFVPTRLDADGEPRALRVPDHLGLLAELECGAVLHVIASKVLGQAGPDRITLYGEDATLVCTGGRLLGARRGESELAELEIADEQRGAWRVEQEFVGAIRGLEPVRLTRFEDGLRYMEFTEAAIRSAAEGRAIDLPLD